MIVVVNADDFGMSASVNKAVEECFLAGTVTSASLLTNFKGYKDAVDKILQYKDWSVGVHLNITEGQALEPHLLDGSLLYDKNGNFNLGFVRILLRSANKEFLFEVENEFRLQLARFPEGQQIASLDSHMHIHAIPAIFDIVCKLAKEYNIPFVRTQFERCYEIPGIKHLFMPKYYINFLKIFILNFFTGINRGTLRKYGLNTNDGVIGVGYTGMMDESTITRGISKVASKNGILEVICHPDKNSLRKSNYREYTALTNRKLIKFLSGCRKTSYREMAG